MIRRSWMVICVALVALSLVSILPVGAGSDSGATFALDCDGFAGTSGSVLLTRDNTGKSREAFVITATDGAGNVIYGPLVDTFFVGGSVSWAGSAPVKWERAPQYNPLALRITSRAGNGLDEELILTAFGACEDLPAYDILPAGAFRVEAGKLLDALGNFIAPLGATSPSVPPNATPPRAANPPEALQGQPGVAIVNTDNLSLRSGDGPQYSLVGVVDGGQQLIVLGRNANASWWYVQAGDLIGWARAQFLVLRGNFTRVPVVEAQGELTQPRLFVYLTQPIYPAPKISDQPVCVVDGNQEYLVEGRNAGGTWFEIQATCDEVLVKGWLSAESGALRNPSGVRIPVTTN